MDTLECIATRRSIRQFLSLPIDQEAILTIVEAGSHAPSCGNLQGWRFVIVDEKPLIKSISEYSLGQESVHNAAFLIVVCSDFEQIERHYGLRGERLYSIQDCAAASENMLLAAHAMGIGGVWIGAFDEHKIRTLLGIPNSVRPQAVLAFGYPAEAPGKKTMMDLSLITFFNHYGSKVKNVHRLLRDYHVDWERRISQAHNAFGRIKDKTVHASKELGAKVKEQVEEKGKPFMGRLRDKFSEMINKNKKKSISKK